MINWDGHLLLAQGWAHYRGIAGDTSFHAHYPAQLVFSDKLEAKVEFEANVMTGRFLSIPSNIPHKLSPSEEVIDLLYVEPSLMSDELTQAKSINKCLAALQETKTGITDIRIVRALEAIDENLIGKVTQEAIIRAAGMSKSSFTELFRTVIEMPLRRYVLWRRLNVAVSTIGEGHDATTASHKAGFSDSAHFSRTMRQTFGVSPIDSVLRIKIG